MKWKTRLYEIIGSLTGLHCKYRDNDAFRGGLSPLPRYRALCLLPGSRAAGDGFEVVSVTL